MYPHVLSNPVDGAGSHVCKFTPSKRLKAAHRKYGGTSTLTAFATKVTSSNTREAAIAWLKNKGR